MRGALLKTLALAGLAAGAPLQAFERQVSEPGFVIRVPGLPEVMSEGAADGAAGLSLALQVTRADPGASTRTCAGRFLRALVGQAGMPDRDSIYRAPLGEHSFLVLYILTPGSAPRLHAHLLAASQGSHCVDAHFSRALRAGEDEDHWRQSFRGATIEDLPR